jgi:acetylornithine deacetylase
MIAGGVARNVVPDTCEFFVDIRTTPPERHADLVQRARAAARSEVHVHSDRLEAMETPADSVIVQAVRTALPEGRPAGSPAMSDMVFLTGVPAVKIGPGESRRSHTADEYVTAAELQAGADAYERIALEYFRRAGAAR